MILTLFLLTLAVLFILLIILINFNHRVAYALYKIPKVHYFVQLICVREKAFLKESILFVPDSIMCAIDDMGWVHGSDLRERGGPSRLITKRDPTLSDYESVKYIAEKAGTRLLGLFVLSEMDKQGVCAKKEYNMPVCESNMTEYGTEWNNRIHDGYTEKVMAFMYENSSYIEFGLHGVRHEYFTEHGYVNAEWANGETGESWGREHTEMQCKVFLEILRQYFSENRCAFPVCFVPPSHAFAFYSEDASILHKYGVKYACSSCSSRPSMKSLKHSGAYHDGILFLDRTENHGVNVENNIPSFIPFNSWIGTHFPNYWGRNHKGWVRYLRGINRNLPTMLGRNSAENYSQWIYTHYCACQFSLNTIKINNLYMPSWAVDNNYVTGIWLKFHIHKGNHLSELCVSGLKVAGYYEDEFDNGYVYIIDENSDYGNLQNKIYNGTYKIAKTAYSGTYIDLFGETFSILSLSENNQRVDISLKIYGTHEVRLHMPKKVSRVADISLSDDCYTVKNNIITVNVRAQNMMGELKQFYVIYE